MATIINAAPHMSDLERLGVALVLIAVLCIVVRAMLRAR